MRRLLAILTFLAACLAPGEAPAHASLHAASPPDGAFLEAAPAEILLRFSEPVVPLSVTLEAADGARLEARLEAGGDGSGLRLLPAAALPRGSYLVRWRVASVDGHPVAGRTAFAVGMADPPVVAAAGADEPGRLRLAAVRLLHLATTIAGAGAGLALCLLPLGPRAARATARFAVGALAAALAAAVVRALATGLEAQDLPASALLGVEPWRAAHRLGLLPPLATTAAGVLLLLPALRLLPAPRLLPALRLLPTLRRRAGTRAVVPLAGLGVLLAAAGFGLGGHTASAPPTAVFAPLLVLHVALAMFWLGALVPLGLSLRLDPPATARAVLERFSERAILLVPLLLLVGTLLAMRQMPEGGLLDSLWGRILLLKLALLAGLLSVAAVNRSRLLPRLAADDATAAPRLRRLLAVDGGLALLLLAATAALTTTPPPRLLAPAVAEELLLAEAGLIARVRIVPGAAGWNRVEVRVPRDPPPAEVRLVLRPLGPEAQPVEAIARPDGVDAFRTDPLLLVPAGAWRLGLGILLDPFTRVELAHGVELR
jgi:copper transport protein